MKHQYGSWSNLEIFMRTAGPVESHATTLPLRQQLLEGCRLRISEVGRLTVPGMFNARNGFADWINVNMAVYLPVAAVIFWGWQRLIRSKQDVLLLTVPFYVGLYIYWPFDQAGRFFAPLLPVLFLSLWTGLERMRSRRRIFFGLLSAAHFGVALGFWLCSDRPAALRAAEQWPELKRLAELVRNEPDQVKASAGLKSEALILSYLLDRRIEEQPVQAAQKSATRWLVAAANGREPAGFAPYLETEHYCLLHRCDYGPLP
jgi:hypothetical protein